MPAAAETSDTSGTVAVLRFVVLPAPLCAGHCSCHSRMALRRATFGATVSGVAHTQCEASAYSSCSTIRNHKAEASAGSSCAETSTHTHMTTRACCSITSINTHVATRVLCIRALGLASKNSYIATIVAMRCHGAACNNTHISAVS